MKIFILLSAFISLPMFVHYACIINAMNDKTSEAIRWSVISIAFGYGTFIFSPLAYKESMWIGMKMFGFGVVLLVTGYAALEFFNRRKHDYVKDINQMLRRNDERLDGQ